MELTVKAANPMPEVSWNFEEIKVEVAAKAKEYATIVYTDEQEKEMKADRAKLNRFVNSIEDERKRIKAIYNEPYKKFEAQVKEVLEPMRDTIRLIDGGLQMIEDKWKKQREILLRNEWTNHINELREVVTFDKIDDGSQYKKTITDKKAIEWMHERIRTIREDLVTLEVVPEEHRTQAIAVYLGGWSISQAIAEGKRLQELADRMKAMSEQAAKLAQEAEERKAQEGQQMTFADCMNPPEQPTPSTIDEPAPEKRFQISFRAHGTKDQLMALKEFMELNNIEFERL